MSKRKWIVLFAGSFAAVLIAAAAFVALVVIRAILVTQISLP
jgi:hypothetical protein